MEKFSFWTFRRWEIRSCFDSKSWSKMIFSSAPNTMFFEYGKVLVMNFSEIGNTVFFWCKKLMESWYFLGILELFMMFQDLGNMVFCAVVICCDRENLNFNGLSLGYTFLLNSCYHWVISDRVVSFFHCLIKLFFFYILNSRVFRFNGNAFLSFFLLIHTTSFLIPFWRHFVECLFFLLIMRIFTLC